MTMIIHNNNRLLTILTVLLLTSTCLSSCAGDQTQDGSSKPEFKVIGDIPPPDGFERVVVNDRSFGEYLRELPLKPKGTPVYLYDGSKKYFQSHHYRVVDMDIGDRDLLQCADAVMRLRAEYLYSMGEYDRIHFNFTSGDTASFRNWIDGHRPRVSGNTVSWSCCEPKDSSYAVLQSYLETVYMYAGTYSLKKELISLSSTDDVRLGDVYIIGGFPGHAMIVADVCVNEDTGERAIMLVQGFTPAQDIHIVAYGRDESINPWYIVGDGERLETPSWTFKWTDVRRFPE